jgi:alpha-tubulin suppressor-like RCC1 family protein
MHLMRTRHVNACAGLALATVIAACTDSQPDPLTLNGPAVGLSAVSGNNQIGKQGTSLSQPLVVSVRDGNGQPVPAHEITWSATGGTFSVSVDSTGDDGVASVTWTLPSTPGKYTATATAVVGSVNFNAQGTPTGTLVKFRYIDAGSYHSCGLTTDEELLCWGYNGDGQLGIEPSEPLTSPNLIEFPQQFREVSGGRYHTCGLTLSGGINCWGQDRDSRSIPGDPLSFQTVRAGLVHTCALTYSREIWCWGSNNECQILKSSLTPCPHAVDSIPQIVSTPAFVGENYRILTVGGIHTCGVQEDGRAFCWGFAKDGQTGTVGNSRIDTIPTLVNTTQHFVVDPLIAPPHPDPDFPLPPGPVVAAG